MVYRFPRNGRDCFRERRFKQWIADDYGRSYTRHDGGLLVDQGGFSSFPDRPGA